MRYLDDDLINKYKLLPQSGKSIVVDGLRDELNYASAHNLISRLTRKIAHPTPTIYAWLKQKIEDTYSFYFPDDESI